MVISSKFFYFITLEDAYLDDLNNSCAEAHKLVNDTTTTNIEQNHGTRIRTNKDFVYVSCRVHHYRRRHLLSLETRNNCERYKNGIRKTFIGL